MSAKMLFPVLGTCVIGAAAVVYICSLGGGPAPVVADVSRPENTTKSENTLLPRAVVDETNHDFGVMDVGGKGEHTFTLRNEGQAPLTVKSGGTSCKCTLLEAADGAIPPGEERKLRVEWETPEAVERFRHGAILHTNDPENREMHLIIEGQVRTFCGLWPPVVAFADMLPTERRTQSVVVYSQTWDDFSIADVVSPEPHLKSRVQPADPAALAKLGARSGYEVELTLEPGLPVGNGQTNVQVLLHVPSDPKIPQGYSREIPVGHEVVGAFSIYGRNVEGKSLRLGAVPRQRGAKDTLSLYVRGEHRDLKVSEIHADPEFLRVAIRRDEKVQGKTARYLIDVEVPPNSPVVDRMRKTPAKIELVTDHPTSPRVKFFVEFAVLE